MAESVSYIHGDFEAMWPIAPPCVSIGSAMQAWCIVGQGDVQTGINAPPVVEGHSARLNGEAQPPVTQTSARHKTTIFNQTVEALAQPMQHLRQWRM